MDTEARDCNCIVFVAGVVIVLYFVAVHRLPCGGGHFFSIRSLTFFFSIQIIWI